MGTSLIAELRSVAETRLAETCNVTLFGSVARGSSDEKSDLDVLVVWKNRLSAGPGAAELAEKQYGALEAFEDEVRSSTGWYPETCTFVLEEVRELLLKPYGMLPQAALEGVSLHGSSLQELVEVPVRFDPEADRLHRREWNLDRALSWRKSLETVEAAGHGTLTSPSFLWEIGRWSSASLLAHLGAARLQDHRIERALHDLEAAEENGMLLEGTASALEELSVLHLLDEAGDEPPQERVDSARLSAEHLLREAKRCAGAGSDQLPVETGL